MVPHCLGRLTTLLAKINLTRDKHSSLFCRVDSVKEKVLKRSNQDSRFSRRHWQAHQGGQGGGTGSALEKCIIKISD